MKLEFQISREKFEYGPEGQRFESRFKFEFSSWNLELVEENVAELFRHGEVHLYSSLLIANPSREKKSGSVPVYFPYLHAVGKLVVYPSSKNIIGSW